MSIFKSLKVLKQLKIIVVLSLLMLLAGSFGLSEAWAATWQWSSGGGRERIILNLDQAKQEKTTGRTNLQEISVQLQSSPQNFEGNALPVGSLVEAINAQGQDLKIKLRDAAFGYVVSRPNARSVIIDVFPDPLGTRWRNPGAPAAPTAASRASSALPQAPPVPTPTAKTERTTPAQATSPATSQATTTPTATPSQAETTPATSPATSQAPAQAIQTPPETTAGRRPAPRGTAAKAPASQLNPAKAGNLLPPIPVLDPEQMPTGRLNAPVQVGVSGSGGTVKVSPPLPSAREIAAITKRIDTLPLDPEDVKFTWQNEVKAPMAPAGSTVPVAAPTKKEVAEGKTGIETTPSPTAQATAPTPSPTAQATAPTPSPTAQATAPTPTPTAQATAPTPTPTAQATPVQTAQAPPVPLPQPSQPVQTAESPAQIPTGRGPVPSWQAVLQENRGTDAPNPNPVNETKGSMQPLQTALAPRGLREATGGLGEAARSGLTPPNVAGTTPPTPSPTPSAPTGVPSPLAQNRMTVTPLTEEPATSTLGQAQRQALLAQQPTPAMPTATPLEPVQVAANSLRGKLGQMSGPTPPTQSAPTLAQTPATPQAPVMVAEAPGSQPIQSAQPIQTTQPVQAVAQNVLRGQINAGGPETWPVEEGLSTVPETALSAPSTTLATAPPTLTASSSATATTPRSTPANQSPTTPSSTPATQSPTTPSSAPATPATIASAPSQMLAEAPAAPPLSSSGSPSPASPELSSSRGKVTGSTSTSPAPPQTGQTGIAEVKKPVTPAEAEPGTTEAQAKVKPPEGPVIYVDEQGNEVPKPPDSLAMLEEARKALNSLQFSTAKDLLEQLKTHVLSPEQRETVLYMLSQVNYGLYQERWLEGYEPIVSTTNEAMNFNLRSERVAEALFRLGMINLNIGNQDEAAGYFGALKLKFPTDPNVPIAYYRLGKTQFDKGQYADAVRNFQVVLSDYPESRSVRESSRYMAEALFKQGHNDRALILVDFVDRRWPRLYLDDPDFLAMVGELQYQEDRLPAALETYWTYYNLIPDNPLNSQILLRIGTIYYKDGLLKGGRDVFNELLRKFPESVSAPIALQRLGEDGLYDGNLTLDELNALFSRDSITSPDIYYQRIIAEYPKSPEAVLAEIRLAAWELWNQNTQKAMRAARTFLNSHPASIYATRAEEIIKKGFAQELALNMEEENYERILSLWADYPEAQTNYSPLPDNLRVALARATLNRGAETEGMDMLAPFLDRPAMDKKYGEYVYNLFLARALRTENWNDILDLGDKVEKWDFNPTNRGQLDYARAISAENMGLAAKALPIWRKLHNQNELPLYQKAYATYFMARDAERKRDLKDAYDLNLTTLKLFTQLEEEGSDKADSERVRESLAALMDVTEVANRYAEALDWAEKYAAFVPNTSPDYAGLRFRQARLYRKMGDLARWKMLLDEIIQREPDSVFGRMAASELRTQEVARDLTRFTP